mmetsp:Transcript_46364/g.109733  ORF Transcript_46364/g.109733 Transcript_46364/m.109733 type:complete len:275 (-) Transcript_46364:902-1726(-)
MQRLDQRAEVRSDPRRGCIAILAQDFFLSLDAVDRLQQPLLRLLCNPWRAKTPLFEVLRMEARHELVPRLCYQPRRAFWLWVRTVGFSLLCTVLKPPIMQRPPVCSVLYAPAVRFPVLVSLADVKRRGTVRVCVQTLAACEPRFPVLYRTVEETPVSVSICAHRPTEQPADARDLLVARQQSDDRTPVIWRRFPQLSHPFRTLHALDRALEQPHCVAAVSFACHAQGKIELLVCPGRAVVCKGSEKQLEAAKGATGRCLSVPSRHWNESEAPTP